MAQGIAIIRWTFDPLLARNAHLNVHKLGAICDRFARNYYGPMTDILIGRIFHPEAGDMFEDLDPWLERMKMEGVTS